MPLPNSKVESFKNRWPLRAGVWELPEWPEKARSNETLKCEHGIGYGPHERVWKIVPFPGEDRRTHRVLVERPSVPGKVHDIVSRLIKHYPREELDAV